MKSRKYNKQVADKMGRDAGLIYERIRHYCTKHNVLEWEQTAKSMYEWLEMPKRTFFLVVNRMEEAGLISRRRGQNTTYWKLLVWPQGLPQFLVDVNAVKGRGRKLSPVKSSEVSEVQQDTVGSAISRVENCNKSISEVQQGQVPIYERTLEAKEISKTEEQEEISKAFVYPAPPSTEKKAMPTKTKTKTEDLSSVQIPHWMDPERWEDYIGHREDIKQALSARSARSTIRVLQEWVDLDNGDPKRAMSLLDQVIASGKWTAPWAPSAKDKPFISQYKPKHKGMTDEELANWEPPKSCRDTPKIKIIN